MERWLGRFSTVFYALLRIVAGVLFACHGAQKVFGILGGQKQEGLLQVAGIIELVAGILIAVGLFTGFVAFIACGEMAVAYFKQHAPGGFWPIVNKGELSVLFCFIFFYFASIGSGILSIDALIGKAKRR